MLEPTHFVYDTSGAELLALCETEDGKFVFDPAWEATDIWLSFVKNQEDLWQITEAPVLDENDSTTTILGKFASIDDAVRYYWKDVLGC